MLSHYNDARGIAYPSIARLVGMGLLWITRVPKLLTHGYKVDEAAIFALQGGDLCAPHAENTTQNGKNGIELKKDAAPSAPSTAGLNGRAQARALLARWRAEGYRKA